MPVEIPRGFKPLEGSAEKHGRLVKARQDAATELRRLDEELTAAIEKDRAAFANALAKDVEAAAPAAKAEQKAREKIAATKSRYDALATAIADIERETDATVERNRARWLADAKAGCEKRRARYADTVDELGEARAEYDVARALIRWLEGWPLGKAARPLPVAAFIRQNGEQTPFADVLRGLRDDALQPEDRPEHTLARLAPGLDHAA
jgi:hypothetical protein